MDNAIIIRPIITEKSMRDAKQGRFTFAVLKTATKPVLKLAVEKMFKVQVVSVTTSIIKGKRKRVGARRIEVIEQPTKKAIVALVQGQKIELFDVEEKS